jgi:hypothetical protein
LQATIEGTGDQSRDRRDRVRRSAELEVQVSGPKLRLPRPRPLRRQVANPGDADAAGVSVTHQVPSGYKFISAEEGGEFDTTSKSITWSVGAISARPYEGTQVRTHGDCAGDFAHKGHRERGSRTSRENRIESKIEGLSAVAMEVTDSDDPLEVGTDTTYEIRIANTGSKDETDVRLVCTLPAQLKFKGARSPGKFDIVGNEIVFENLPKLPAKTEVTYKLTVTAVAKGDARFKATMTAGGLSEPVVKQESTRVYSD